MKRPIKLIAAVVAFVFTLEQVAYPAPYPGQRRRNPSALRAVASKAGVPAGAPVEFFKGTDSLRTPEEIETLIAGFKGAVREGSPVPDGEKAIIRKTISQLRKALDENQPSRGSEQLSGDRRALVDEVCAGELADEYARSVCAGELADEYARSVIEAFVEREILTRENKDEAAYSLVTIIKAVKKHRIGALLCLKAMALNDVITKDDFEEINAAGRLIIPLYRSAEEHAGSAFACLRVLTEEGAVTKKNLYDIDRLISTVIGGASYGRKISHEEALIRSRCLMALTKAGAVTKDNIFDVQELFKELFLRELIDVRIYTSMIMFADECRVKDLDPVILDVDLLKTIMRHFSGSAEEIFSQLILLAEGVKNQGLAPVILDRQLLITDAKRSPFSTNKIYESRLALATIVKEENLNTSILDRDLLIAFAEGGLFAFYGHQFLAGLARFAKKRGYDEVKLDDSQTLEDIFLDPGLVQIIAYLQPGNTHMAPEKEGEFQFLPFDITKMDGNSFISAGAKEAIKGLTLLCDAYKAGRIDNRALNKKLLREIASNAGEKSGAAYIALTNLAKAATNKSIDSVVLSTHLLITITKNAGLDTANAYTALLDLARAVRAKRLKAIADRPETGNGAVGAAFARFGKLCARIELTKGSKGFSLFLDPNNLAALADGTHEYVSYAYSCLTAFVEAEATTEFESGYIKGLLEYLPICKRKKDAYAILRALTEAGAVTPDKFPEVWELFRIIDEKGDEEGDDKIADTYKHLRLLAEAVNEKDLDRRVLDINLLTTIVKEIEFPAHAYYRLRELAESVKENDLETGVLDVKLLTTIAHRAGENARYAYSALRFLAESVKDNNLDAVLLNSEFLWDIAMEAHGLTNHAYRCLQALAEAGAITGANRSKVINHDTPITKIAMEAECEKGMAYKSLQKLAKAVKEKGLNLAVLDFGLLSTIVEKGKKQTHIIYDSLTSLAVSVKENNLNSVVLDLEFLTAIAMEAGPMAGFAYTSLRVLAEAGLVTEDTIPEIQSLLIDIAKHTGGSLEGPAPDAHESLAALAKKGVVTERNIAKVKSLIVSICSELQNIDVAKSAYAALIELTDIGAVTKRNLAKIETLFTAIYKRTGDNAYHAFGCLEIFASEGAATEGNVTKIVRDLLIPAGRLTHAEDAYASLSALVRAGAITKDETTLNKTKTLFTTIKIRAGANKSAYTTLETLAAAVNVEGLNAVVLDLRLLTDIAECATVYAGGGYNGLQLLARSAKEKGLESIVLDLNLLTGLAAATKKAIEFAYVCLADLVEAEVVTKDNIPEIKSFLIDILGDEQNHPHYEHSGPCLHALIRAGVVTKDNLDKVKSLLFTIDAKAWLKHKEVYRSLSELATEVKSCYLDLNVLDLDLLTTIAKIGQQAEYVYDELRALVSVVTAHNLDVRILDPKLLTVIASNAGAHAKRAYEFLGLLASSAKENILPRAILKPDFLIKIAERTKAYVWRAFAFIIVIAKERPVAASEIQALFNAFPEGIWDKEDYANPICDSLINLVDAVRRRKISPLILNFILLTTIAEKAGYHANEGYHYLEKIAENLEGILSPEVISEIIIAINVVHGDNGAKGEVAVSDYLRFLSKQRGVTSPLKEAIEYLQETFGIIVEESDIYLYLIPAELREKIEGKNIDNLFQEVNEENYTREPYSIYLYLKLRKEIPSSAGLTYEEFLEIIRVEKESIYAGLITNFISLNVLGQELTLLPKQQDQIISLSIDLHKKIFEKLKEASDVITFRELVRFNVDFSTYYLKEKGLTNVLEFFILTAHNIYGRVIRDEEAKQKFIAILAKRFMSGKYRGLFGQAQVSSALLRGDLYRTTEDIITYGHYEDLTLKPADEEIPLEVSIESLIRRATQVRRPLLLKVGSDNSLFVEDVLRGLGKDEEREAFSLSMNGFTKRQELFGMYLPRKVLPEEEIEAAFLKEGNSHALKEALSDILGLKEDEVEGYFEEWKEDLALQQDGILRWAIASYLKYGKKWRENFSWQEGILVRLAQEASRNPEKSYFLVFENIEACPDRVRVLLNPVLWEKMVEIPEKGTRLSLPGNLQMLFTMHRDSEIKDAAFMDRPLVLYADSPIQEDIMRYLTLRIGLSEKTSNTLLYIFDKSEMLELDEEVHLGFIDMVEIARRVKGMSDSALSEEQILDREAYNYLYLRLRRKKDRERLKRNVFRDEEFPKPATSEVIGNHVFFDSVGIKLSDEFLAYARKYPDKTFRELLLGFYKFVATDLEIRILCQLARALKFGGRVVQLEGPSGEGKTEISRVFSHLAGLDLEETTVNEDTDLSGFRGQIRPERRGYYLYEPPYLSQIEEGGNLFLLNEINTNQNASLYHWLFPEIAGRPVKHLSEFATPEGEGIVKTGRINRNNLWLFTVNPEVFNGRESTPPRISSHIPSFHMALDLEDLEEIIEMLLFTEKYLDCKKYSIHVLSLSNIHKAFKNALSSNQFTSPQDVTKRELIRTIEKFKRYIERGFSPDLALRRAAHEVYTYMWIHKEDVDKARQIVEEKRRKITARTSEEARRQSLEEEAPLLVIYDATKDPHSIEEEIKDVNPQAEILPITLSYFHRTRQFLGGLIPKKGEPFIKRLWGRKLQEVAAPLEMGLGIIPRAIEKARLNPEKQFFAVFYNYTHLNPRVAPLLNEFLQVGKIGEVKEFITSDIAGELIDKIKKKPDVGKLLREEYEESKARKLPSWEEIDEKDALAFAQWFYSNSPSNLRVVATGSSLERTYLSQAELDRFVTVNVSEELSKEWLKAYIWKNMPKNSDGHKSFIASVAIEAWGLYQEQAGRMEYEHNRLGKSDIDVFLKELSKAYFLNEDFIRETAYYTLGIGLRKSYREKLSFKPWELDNPEGAIGYDKREDGIYLVVDGIDFKTNFDRIPKDDFLAPTQNLVRHLASMLIALRNQRPLILEGLPGGGKTAFCQELAKRLGIPFYNVLMYEDIDLGDFLGRLARRGRKIILTSDKDAEGRYLLDFLKAYSEGGMFLLDEGAIGVNSQEVISYLAEISRAEELDLSTFHPGLKGEIIKRNPGFVLAITQNPAKTTRAREPIPYRADTLSAKIWTDNILTAEDAMRIIDYYLGDKKDMVSWDLKAEIVATHLEFSKELHPNKEELSPRQLIMVIHILRDALEKKEDIGKAVFRGIMLSYLTGLSQEDFNRLWRSARRNFREMEFDRYLTDWKKDIVIRKEDSTILFDGIKLPKSKDGGNVNKEDIILFENLPSVNKTLKEIALGLSLNMPLALLEEDGADTLDILKKFAYLTEYELHTLWSHPQMTKMHLLSTILPGFEEEFDRYGIKRQDLSSEFIMSLGFLLRHLLPSDKYEKEKSKPQARKILFFNLFDAIPERQRVLLNEILTEGRITIQDEKGGPKTYILPEWVHIVVSAPVEHQFSSAFINRFLQIRANFPSGHRELKRIIQNRYPLVRDEEVGWISTIARGVYSYDKEESFGLHYGFGPRDIFKLARLVQMEKQADIQKQKFNPNPLYYLFKASYIMYYLALEDKDREKFENEIIVDFLKRVFKANRNDDGLYLIGGDEWDMHNIYRLTYLAAKTVIEEELSSIETFPYQLRVDIIDLSPEESILLDNGISIQRVKEGFIIKTPGNTYKVKDEELKEWNRLSSGLAVKRENEQLLIELNLIKSIGGIEIPRTEMNNNLSLPQDEVSTPEFIYYTRDIKMLVSSLLRSWQRVKDYTGRVRFPRAIFLSGETGTAKTALVRNLSRVCGIPLYILNSHEELKISDITVGLKLSQGRFEVGLKEFLARCGEINGKRIYIPSKNTSSRTALMIDEANASGDILFALIPLFRGEGRFSLEYAGENFGLELDKDVMQILTFNPSERYSGREAIAREISFHADKLWTPNPLNYNEWVLGDILSEYHRRGISEAERREERPMVSVSREDYIPVEPETIEVKALIHPPVYELEDELKVAKGEPAVLPEVESIGEVSLKSIREVIDTIMEKGREVISDEEIEPKEREIVEVKYPYNTNAGFFREVVCDEVDGLEMVSTLGKEDIEGKSLVSDSPPGFKLLKGDFTSYVGEKWVPLISPAPACMFNIVSYRAIRADGSDVELEFSRGINTDTLYVRASQYTGIARIELNVAINTKVYFGNTIPEDKIPYFEQKASIPAFITKGLEYVKVEDRRYTLEDAYQNPRGFIYDLILFFRDFGTEEDGIERHGKGDSPLLKILSSAQGVCRHRAAAFFVLTRLLGFKTRFVRNQIHAFAELYVRGYGWVRIDLGGGGDPANYDLSAMPEIEEVEEMGDFPEPDSERYKQQAEAYGERMAEALEKAGITGEAPSRSRGGIKGEGEIVRPPSSITADIEKLLSLAPNLVVRFLEIFAGTPKEMKEYSDTGDQIDIEKMITGDLEPFFTKRTVEALASLRCGLTIDQSGSTRGELLDNFVMMARFYSSLFYYSCVRNKEVDFSISTVGDHYHPLLDCSECRYKDRVEYAIGMIKNIKDNGGINTLSIIKGVRGKYKSIKTKEHNLEIVLTDGLETSRETFENLKTKVGALETELNLDMVFIGIETDDVKNYSKYLVLDHTPTTDELIQIIMKLALLKVSRGMLPQGDLKEFLSLPPGTDDPAAKPGASPTVAPLNLKTGPNDLFIVPKPIMPGDSRRLLPFDFDPILAGGRTAQAKGLILIPAPLREQIKHCQAIIARAGISQRSVPAPLGEHTETIEAVHAAINSGA